jgi:hypothetical protein
MPKVQTVILRYAGRHPRRTIRIGVMTSPIAKRIAKAKARHYARAAMMPAKRAARDHRVHRESQLALKHVVQGLTRAEHVGAGKAFDDRRVKRELQRAAQHATRAARFTITPPPRLSARRKALIATGVGVGTAGLLAARLRSATPPDLTVPAPVAAAPEP